MDYDKLLEFCTTAKQQELVRAVDICNGNVANACRLLKWDGAGTIYRRMFRQIKAAAAKSGYAPESSNMKGGAPDGYAVKRHSARFDKDGNAAGGWLISEPTKEQAWEAFTEAANDVVVQLKGLSKPTPAPKYTDEDLLTVIPMGDPHFGLLSWAMETGEDFDLEIAERLTFNAVDRLASMTPSTGVALLLNLGDYFHADNGTNRTPRGNNVLDVDGRFSKIASIGFRAMIRCIDRLLEKHGKVLVRNNRGNHDPHQAAMLTIAVAAYYHDNARVDVSDSPSGFYFYRFGKVLIGSTHGDGAKLKDLPLIMANDAPVDWAASMFRVWHCGHFHHDQVLKDLVGCTVETHRTLAAGDAWHRYEGYRAGRGMKAIVYHKMYGEVSRVRCGVEMLEAA